MQRPSRAEIEAIAYRGAFGQVLCKAVAEILNAPEGHAIRYMNELYPVPLQMAAADAGKELALDVHAAVTYMIVCESNSAKNSISFLSRLLSGEKAAKHRDHNRMLKAGTSLMELYWDPAVFGQFVQIAGANFLERAERVGLRL